MKLIKSIKKWFKDNQKIINFLLAALVVWRVVLVILTFIGSKFLPLREGSLGGGTALYLKNPLLWSWANFDGVYYLTIAERGYSQFQHAFFPLYPYLIRSVADLIGNYLLSGLLISHFSLIIALYLFYKLVRLDYSEGIARRCLVYLLIFPTAFYFGSLYTESLFLALILGSFYAARKKHWWIAGILGAFASATRFVGIFLFPALLVEWYLQKGERKKKITEEIIECLPLFFIAVGLLFYMGYLKETVGDPLYFIHIQPLFGAQQTGSKLILIYQVFWRYFKMLLTVEKLTPTYFVVILETLTAVAFLFLTIFAYLRRWFAYVTFMALAFIAPTLTGTFSSLPRYVLVLFPGFILLAIWAEKYKSVRILYPLIAIPLLIVSLFFFTRGFWLT